jgi:hypothetical protein
VRGAEPSSAGSSKDTERAWTSCSECRHAQRCYPDDRSRAALTFVERPGSSSVAQQTESGHGPRGDLDRLDHRHAGPGDGTGRAHRLTATAGNGQASLSWTAPASNGGVNITSYKPGGGGHRIIRLLVGATLKAQPMHHDQDIVSGR